MAFIKGLGMGASLIVAIGAQNAFVLVQGIRRNHHLLVALLCAVIDALLIGIGVLGVGGLIASHPYLQLAASLGGATFLFLFGLKSLHNATRQNGLQAGTGLENNTPLLATVSATLAVSLLNPHVYLDTVMMLGAISGSYPGPERYLFGLGAVCASFIWFFSLALGGTVLAPVFTRPRAWRILGTVVCLTVWLVAAGLTRNAWEIYRSHF